MALGRNSRIATTERAAIIESRNQEKYTGAYELARRIVNNPAHAASKRPFYSILSVIRRYDAKQKSAAPVGV